MKQENMEKSYPLSARIIRDLGDVENELIRVISAYDGELGKPAVSTVEAGGKRLRPALVLVCGQAGDYDLSHLMPAALSVELVHTATLVHDDVLDQTKTRRGVATVNASWGSSTAVATGNLLLGKAFSLISENSCNEAVKVLADVAEMLSYGELRQQQSVSDLDFGVDTCLTRIKYKTASLFSGCCQLGSLATSASGDDIAALKKYGEYLGMAFQIFDDILDFEADEDEFGKPVGSDLRDGIPSYPIVIALEKEHSRNLRKVLLKRRPSDADISESMDYITRCGAIEKSREDANSFIKEAYKATRGLSKKSLIPQLESISQFVVDRYN